MKKLTALALIVAASILGKSAMAAGGATTCEIGLSTGTTPVSCRATAGSLFHVSIDSVATAGDWIVCYDSATTTGFTAGSVIDGTAAAPKIAALVTATTGVTASEAATMPVRTVANGIVCIQRIGTQKARVYHGP